MSVVATSTSTPTSAQRRRSACVSAAYWFCRIGWTAARRRTGPVQPAGADHLERLLAREVRLAAAGVVAEDPRRDDARGGQREAPEGAPDEVLRARDVPRAPSAAPAFDPAGLAVWKTAKYVFFLGVSTSPPRRRGSRRIASRSCGSRSRATSSSPDRRPSAICGGRQGGAELDPVERRAGRLPVARVALEDDRARRVRGERKGPVPSGGPAPAPARGDRGPPVGQQRREDRERVGRAGFGARRLGDGLDPGDRRGLPVQKSLDDPRRP